MPETTTSSDVGGTTGRPNPEGESGTANPR